jgi:hypothetical protein
VTGLKNGPARTGVRELTYRLVFIASGTQVCGLCGWGWLVGAGVDWLAGWGWLAGCFVGLCPCHQTHTTLTHACSLTFSLLPSLLPGSVSFLPAPAAPGPEEWHDQHPG